MGIEEHKKSKTPKPSPAGRHDNSMMISRRSAAPRIWLAAAVPLVLLATDSFRIGGFAGANVAVSVVALSLPLILFVLANGSRVVGLLPTRRLLAIAFIYAAYPMLTISYTDGIGVAEEIIKRVINVLIVVASTVLFLLSGEQRSLRVIFACLAVSMAGAALSLVSPQVFQPLRALAGAVDQYDGRAFGFPLQPNSLGISVVFIALAILASTKANWLRLGVILSFVTIASTASRFSLVIFLLSLILFSEGSRRAGQSALVAIISRGRVAWSLLFLWLAAFALFNIFDLAQYAQQGNVFDRLNAILGGSVRHSVDREGIGSLIDRMDAQQYYWDYIAQRPVLGYGIGTGSAWLISGQLYVTAHSSFLEQALDYGLLYSLAVLLVFIWPLRPLREKAIRDYAFFGFLLALCFIFNHGIFESYTLFVIFAFFYARAITARASARV